MMDATMIARAAELLGRARLNHAQLKSMPDGCIPLDEASGYAIQEALSRWLAKKGLGDLAGYKIGLVSADMRASLGGVKALGVDSPVYGGILSKTVYHGVTTLSFDDFIRPYVEGEFAVRIGADVPLDRTPFTRESIAAYVEACMAGMELVDWRLSYFDCDPPLAPLMIADRGSNWGCVVGAPMRNWCELDLAALRGRMTVNGVDVGGGVGANLQGHPFEVLGWSANSLARRGKTLQKGQIVMLGSVTPSYGSFDRGAEVVVTWDELGEVRARFD